MNQAKEHEQLIAQLGGSKRVADYCAVRLNVASNWRWRGVPWRYRHKVAQLAIIKNVTLPPDFLVPAAQDAAE